MNNSEWDNHWQQIDTLLDEVKLASMALEINTSGYKYRGLPFPLPEIIAMAATAETYAKVRHLIPEMEWAAYAPLIVEIERLKRSLAVSSTDSSSDMSCTPLIRSVSRDYTGYVLITRPGIMNRRPQNLSSSKRDVIPLEWLAKNVSRRTIRAL